MSFTDKSHPEHSKSTQDEMEKLQQTIDTEELSYSKRLLDCKASPRINEWETSFLNNLIESFKKNIITRFYDLSQRQKDILVKIEKKVHAAG